MNRKIVASTFAVLALLGNLAHGQMTARDSLVEKARNEVDSTALNLFMKALDPALGQPDSAWAVAGYELASILQKRDSAEAAIWLRFVVRHGEWPLDRRNFPPVIHQLYDAAVRAVAASRDRANTVGQTNWRWPQRYTGRSPGAVEVRSRSAGVPIEVAVPGEQSWQGGSLTLQPGSHSFVISAADYRPVSVTREVLPGVTTVLNIDLSPVLLSQAEQGVLARLVRITVQRDQNPSCGTGYIAGPGGIIVTTYSNVRNARTIRATDVNNTELGDARVVTIDTAQDIAVLKVASSALPLMPAPDLNAARSAWSTYFNGCGSNDVAETRINADGATLGSLARPLPAAANGAPLIDRQGMLLGMVTGPERFATSPILSGVLARAARQPAVAQARSPRRFPWLWVSGGAAVVGVAAGVLAGGGGKPEPTTGGIVVTIPR